MDAVVGSAGAFVSALLLAAINTSCEVKGMGAQPVSRANKGK